MAAKSGFNSNRFKDMTGLKFGRWTVLGFDHWDIDKNGYKHAYWKCQCECGIEKPVNGSSLRVGRSLSCGCLSSELSSKRNSKINKYTLLGNYYVGTTNNGIDFLIDEDDYDLVSQYCWYASKDGYLYTHSNGHQILMHRLIMNIPNDSNLVVDHINHNTLDNRKSQLRLATRSQNGANSKLHSNNKTGHSGIYYRNDIKKWSSEIRVNNKKIMLGCYENFEDAVNARKDAESQYFGEFSYKNTIN